MTPSQPDTAPVTRLRYTSTMLAPLAVGAICALPLAIGLGGWGLLFAVPFLLAIVVLRSVGLDIEAKQVRVRGAFSAVTIPRSDLIGFSTDGRHVALVRSDESTVRIPTVRPRDLPMLREKLFSTDAPRVADEESAAP